ncbi:MAG: LamG-like jellyroll fold domain-containing protein [Bacteroidota bacterium]
MYSKQLILAFLLCFSFAFAQDNPIAHYPFQGNADDATGNGYNGTIIGAVLATDRNGQSNSAYEFDGVDDYIEFDFDSTYQVDLPATLSAWIYLKDNGNNVIYRNCFEQNRYHGVWMGVNNRLLSCAYGTGGLVGPGGRRSKQSSIVLDTAVWYHVAAVIRGAQDMEIYIDGKLDCNAVYSGTGGNIAYVNQKGVAGLTDRTSQSGGLDYFTGKMDDIYLFDRALGSEEIRRLAEAGTADQRICLGDSLQLNAGAGSSFVWEMSNDLSCTTCVDPWAIPSANASYVVDITDTTGCTFSDTVTLEVVNCPQNRNGLVAYYPFDGNALDQSGYTHDGTVMGASLSTDRFGNPNAAYEFDGIDDTIEFLSDSIFQVDLPATISAWVYPEDNGINVIFRNCFRQNKYDGVWIGANNGKFNCAYGTGGNVGPAGRRSKEGTLTYTPQTWVHITAVIRGATDMDIYVNGRPDCNAAYSGTGGNLNYVDAPGVAGLADRTSQSGGLDYFTGKMDEIRLYNRALTLSEIQDLAEIASLDTVICQGDSINLDAGPSASFSWTPSSSLSCDTCQIVQAFPSQSTSYQIDMVGDDGCVTSDSIMVAVESCGAFDCQSLNLTASFLPNTDNLSLQLIGQSSGGTIDQIEWDFGNGVNIVAMPGQNISYTYDSAGTYTVCMNVVDSVDAQTICNLTYCDEITVTSSTTSNELPESSVFHIGPNPGSHQLHIESELGGTAELRVWGFDGKEMWKGNVGEGKSTISTSSWPRGLYVIQLRQGDKVSITKWVKQ